jgi:hypothetical protein
MPRRCDSPSAQWAVGAVSAAIVVQLLQCSSCSESRCDIGAVCSTEHPATEVMLSPAAYSVVLLVLDHDVVMTDVFIGVVQLLGCSLSWFWQEAAHSSTS